MDESGRKLSAGVVVLVGIAYFVVGFVFAALANPSVQVRAWRLAAWVASAAVFAAHIGYEHFRLGNPPRAIGLRAAVAVAVGAFLVALAATVHASVAVSHAPYWRFLLALVAWPVITAVPAFLVALVAGAALARLSRKA